VTWALAAANTAIFALVLARGDPRDPDLLVRLGALERGRIWAGEVWRLVTAAFLHGGWQHLAMNVGALLLAGVIVEGPAGWVVRPVAETYVEAERGAPSATVSGLGGVIWRLSPRVSADAAVRVATVLGNGVVEVRAGLTWDLPF